MDNFFQSKLRELIGHGVVDFVVDSEGAGISFENGARLSIYNKMSMGSNLGAASLSIAGARLQDLRRSIDAVVFDFNNGVSWAVDISDAGYFGPEAFQLRSADGEILVWRQDDA